MLSMGFLKRRKKIAWNNLIEISSFVLCARLLVNSKEFDIVHSQGRFWGDFNIATAHSCHAAGLAAAAKESRNVTARLRKSIANPLHFVLLQLEKFTFRRAQVIIAVSNMVKEEIITHYGVPADRIITVYNGVNTGKFNTEDKRLHRAHLRKKYELDESDTVIIFPANEFKRKGLTQIIEAVNMLTTRNISVLVMGKSDPAPFMPLIRSYGLLDKFFFIDETPAIERYYAASDLLVLPASYEPFGLVITEAMASGLPVIVSKDAGASELITNRANGIVLKNYRDSAGIAEAIGYLLADPLKRTVMTKSARETAQQLDWDVITPIVIALYSSIRKNSKPAHPVNVNKYAGVTQ